jgi:hypothetical protein
MVSKERSELTGKDLKMRKVVVHNEDGAFMWVIGSGLPDGRVVEANAVPFPEMLMIYDAWGTALGHVWRVSNPNVDLTSLAILVKLAGAQRARTRGCQRRCFDMDESAKLGVVARNEGKTVGLQAHAGTRADKAKRCWRRRHQGNVRRG